MKTNRKACTTGKRTSRRRATASGQMSLNFAGVNVPVRHAKRTRKAAKTAAAKKTISRAKRIYEEQKQSFADDFKQKIRNGRKPTTAAKEAGANYRSRFGATRTRRWQTALNRASREN